MKHISPGIIVSKIVSPSSSVDINSALVVSGTAHFLGDVIFDRPNFTSSWAVSSSQALTASFAPNYVLNSSTSSFVLNSQTSSFVLNLQTSSMLAPYVLNAQTSSFATTGSNNFNGNQTITGSLIQGLPGNTATGEHSHAEGSITKAIGNYSHAEGDNTQAKGDYSHAEGQETIASGSYSHAEGYQTIA